MESPTSPSPTGSFFSRNRKTLSIAAIVVLLFGIAAWLFLKKKRPADYNQKYAQYISVGCIQHIRIFASQLLLCTTTGAGARRCSGRPRNR